MVLPPRNELMEGELKQRIKEADCDVVLVIRPKAFRKETEAVGTKVVEMGGVPVRELVYFGSERGRPPFASNDRFLIDPTKLLKQTAGRSSARYEMPLLR